MKRWCKAPWSTPFYARRPPKSLDRDQIVFHEMERLSLEDGAATLAALSADAIALSAKHFPSEPQKKWVVAGGGRRNRAIMTRLRAILGAEVLTAEEAGHDGDWLEGHMIAYLTARRLAGLPATFPTTTGVRQPTVGGVVRLP